MLVALKTPRVEEEEFKSLIKRLIINVEARVINSQAPGPESPAAESIFIASITDAYDPFVVIDEEENSDSDSDSLQHIYAVWKLSICILRPRIRLFRPSVVITASAGLKPEASAELNSKSGGYLQSGLPSGLNLLESFASDPALNGIKPRLSALRVSRVAPVTKQQDLITRLRALPQLQLPVSAVVHSRIRFSRPHTAPQTSTIIGQLEFDFTPDLEFEVLLDKIELSTPSGTVLCLTDSAALKLPLSCVSHDHIALLYEIKPHQLDISPKLTSSTLDIAVSASVQVVPTICTPQLEMSWTASLDFNAPTPPTNLAQGSETGIKRAHRPAQLSIGSSQTAVTPLKSPSLIRPDALPTLEASARTETSVPDLGITMSFSTPSEPVHPGDIFSWTVYVLNRSPEKSSKPPRKLALVAILKRRRNESRGVRPPSTASRRQGEKEVAEAAINDNVLHALQKSAVVEGADVVCLSADTRVGPLGPGACHAVELQFLALREGIAEVEAIRVVDLGSQEHVDIRDLPTTIIEPMAS